MRPFVTFIFFVLLLNYFSCMETHIAERSITFEPSYDRPEECMTDFLGAAVHYFGDMQYQFEEPFPANFQNFFDTLINICKAFPKVTVVNEDFASAWDRLFAPDLDYVAIQQELETKGMVNNLTYFLDATQKCKRFISRVIARRSGSTDLDFDETITSYGTTLLPGNRSGYFNQSSMTGKKFIVSSAGTPTERKVAEASTESGQGKAAMKSRKKQEARQVEEKRPEVPVEKVVLRNPTPWIVYIMQTVSEAFPSAIFPSDTITPASKVRKPAAPRKVADVEAPETIVEEAALEKAVDLAAPETVNVAAENVPATSDSSSEENEEHYNVKVAQLRDRARKGPVEKYVKFSSRKDGKNAASMAK